MVGGEGSPPHIVYYKKRGSRVYNRDGVSSPYKKTSGRIVNLSFGGFFFGGGVGDGGLVPVW